MKGVLVLSEGRSGTNWLGSLTDSTGLLGKSGEWIDEINLVADTKKMSCAEYVDTILRSSSTDNGFFSIKIFPRHLYWFQYKFGVDIIRNLVTEHDILCVFITRRERVKQAVSFARALQSGAWTSQNVKLKNEKYDFSQILRCYYGISASYAFWQSYVQSNSLFHISLEYENLIPNPSIYTQAVASHAGLNDLPEVKSELSMQRDDITNQWCARFERDIQVSNSLAVMTNAHQPIRKLSNLIRFMRNRPLKPVPYTIK